MNKHLFLVLFLWGFSQVFGQNSEPLFPGFEDEPRGAEGIRLAFYNCENLFDTKHDSLKRDGDFLPGGNHNWNTYKYWQKQKNISKVISTLGGWEAPAIVGLAEVENLHVLINLVYNTSLKKHKYKILHYPSPDRRGIDVAMIYRPEKVEIIESKPIGVRFPFDTASRTRDILYAKIVVLYTDTLHLFINHWPSRWGGQFQTEPKRVYIAKKIKALADSIRQQNSCSNIIIMGDLNDTPSNKSLVEGLEVSSPKNMTSHLIDLMIPYEQEGKGTHYHKGEIGGSWSVLDHAIVSKSLLESCGSLQIKHQKAMVFKAPFIMENVAGVEKPFRTYLGMRYHGGYSDHLPIYLDLMIKK